MLGRGAGPGDTGGSLLKMLGKDTGAGDTGGKIDGVGRGGEGGRMLG